MIGGTLDDRANLAKIKRGPACPSGLDGNDLRMEFFEVLARRRYIRKFRGRGISEAVVGRIIAAARLAPSSMDGQPWEFIVVRDERMKARLARFKNKWCPKEKREYSADFMKGAPLILVVCTDRKKSFSRWIENGTIAATYALLAAGALGLGGSFMSAFTLTRPGQMRELRGLLGLPDRSNPVVLIPLGRPAETPARKSLRPVAGLMHHETF